MTPIAWVFLLYVVVWLPYVAWRSSHRVRALSVLPPRARLYASALVIQAALFLLAWLAARGEWIELFPAPVIRARDAGIGIAWVALKLARFAWMFRRPEEREKRRVLLHLAPRTPSELAGYAAMVAAASVAEEAAYRGVLFQLAARASGSLPLAALASAVPFGLAHLTQGRRPALTAGILGLGNQLVVWLTGSLWVAIGAHFAYDLAVGIAVAVQQARAAAAAPSKSS